MKKIKQNAVVFADSRSMPELPAGSIHLVVTSPPYYHIKDYGCSGQIGYGQSLHQYLKDLYLVWKECARVLMPGRRLCINIGDQFARTREFGRYKVIPLHAEMINQCERLGLDYMGSIIWQKKTTVNTSGGAVIMGSYPFPPNGILELDYEYILVFKKQVNRSKGESVKIPSKKKKNAEMSLEEWKKYFSGHWNFGGQRKTGHEASFPVQLPHRLIRMFSFEDEFVLDPFLGSGSTLLAALELKRQCIGYEIQTKYRRNIEEKIGLFLGTIPFQERTRTPVIKTPRYKPSIMDMTPDTAVKPPDRVLLKVTDIKAPDTLITDNGQSVTMRGIMIPGKNAEKALAYLKKYLLSRYVELKDEQKRGQNSVSAYVYLKNRLFVNRKMIELGLARASRKTHKYTEKFKKAEKIKK